MIYHINFNKDVVYVPLWNFSICDKQHNIDEQADKVTTSPVISSSARRFDCIFWCLRCLRCLLISLVSLLWLTAGLNNLAMECGLV